MALTKPSEETDIEQLAARIATKSKRKPTTSDHTLYEILLCALANWPLLEPVYQAQLHYANLEDLCVEDFWTSKVNQQLKPKIKP